MNISTARLGLILLLFSFKLIGQNSIDPNCFHTIADFGAKNDGKSDSIQAIRESLEKLDYAYIPKTEKGFALYSQIDLKPNQRIFGEGRGSKLISYVPESTFAIAASNVGFIEDVLIEDLSIIIESENSNGIHVLKSRNVFIDNVFVDGNSKANIGIHIDGGEERGSAWNQLSRYTILKCKIGIEVSSQTRLNFSNRNFIGFGVVQSCDIGVKLYKANTNSINANPQGCPIGFQLDNAKSNRINSIIENSKTSPIITSSNSNNNIFSVGLDIHKISDKGKNNTFNLPLSKQKQFDQLRRN